MRTVSIWVLAAGLAASPGWAADAPPNRKPEQAERVHPLRLRMSDETIASDLATFGAWQRRLDALESSKPPVSLYHRTKAQGWLSFAADEYAKNDHSGATEAAFDQATGIIRGLETGTLKTLGVTPLVAGATRLADSLWIAVDRVQKDPGFNCVAREVARMEIELVRAGHEDREGFDCQSQAHLAAAEALASVIKNRIRDCLPKPVEVPVPMTLRPTPRPPMPMPNFTSAEIKRAIEKLPKYVHFAVDSSAISGSSAAKLDSIASVLIAIPSILVQLEGHTDKRASVAYNLALSRRRANAVRDYLVKAGVSEDRLIAAYMGKSAPRAEGDGVVTFAKNRCVIFTYIPPADIAIEAVPTEGDLKIEGERRPKR